MARKQSANSDSNRSFNDIISVVLLAGALLLLVAQLSFDSGDLSSNRNPPNHPAHNWIGPLGAHVGHATFFVFGFSAYLLPILLASFGLAFWFEPLAYLRRRWPWAAVLLLSCMGWLHLLDLSHLRQAAQDSWFTRVRESISAPSLGGFIGMTMYDYFFWMLGSTGAAIVYATCDVISLLFLTNFQLGQWVRGVWGKREEPKPAAEQTLEKRARELKKQAKELEEAVSRSGLGADGKPVPAPVVTDLSVPSAKPGRSKKPGAEPAKEPEPADEVVVIPAREVSAATTA